MVRGKGLGVFAQGTEFWLASKVFSCSHPLDPRIAFYLEICPGKKRLLGILRSSFFFLVRIAFPRRFSPMADASHGWTALNPATGVPYPNPLCSRCGILSTAAGANNVCPLPARPVKKLKNVRPRERYNPRKQPTTRSCYNQFLKCLTTQTRFSAVAPPSIELSLVNIFEVFVVHFVRCPYRNCFLEF
jgi:hypothetical protein